MRQYIVFAVLWLAAATACAAAGQIQDARIWDAPERTRVVFDLDGPAEYNLFTLSEPERVVIDIADAASSRAPAERLQGMGFVQQVRTGIREGRNLRVVLEVNRSVQPKAFVLTPNDEYGHRLVVDLEAGIFSAPDQSETARHEAESMAVAAAEAATATPEAGKTRDKPAASPPTPAARPSYSYTPRKFVVAVDAGHGGKDPGAIGPRGTYEKNVVLNISRRLARLIDEQPGMSAVLIRDGDYFVGLRERIEKARAAKADLFISIHADAARNHRASGSSVYVLSENGASSEHARWLARRENEAGLMGGVTLKDKDDVLASFMLDLSQGASIEASFDVGNRLLSKLRNLGDVHKSEVQQAGFLVLKSPDIPSVLVETAFISNAAEERRLLNGRHQDRLARALLEGIQGYVASYRPATSVASNAVIHQVSAGETLSEIAEQYGVSLSSLRRLNKLNGDRIRVGAKLEIPGSTLAASGS